MWGSRGVTLWISIVIHKRLVAWPSVSGTQRMRPNGLTVPHPSRFPPARPDYQLCLDAHDEAVAAGRLGYVDPVTGLFVMTAANLVDRGFCCDRECRHCPYTGGSDHAEPSTGTEEKRNASE